MKPIITAAEYRKLTGAKTRESKAMSAQEWREMMKRKGKTTGTAKQVNEIRIMLQLARIQFVEEHRFHPTRKWRFDFAIPEMRIALEYEGLFSEKSGHTTIDGFLSDVEKYNEATKLGWRILRYTVKNYKNVIGDIEQVALSDQQRASGLIKTI